MEEEEASWTFGAARSLLSSTKHMDWRDREFDEILNEQAYFPVAHYLLPMIYFKLTGSWRGGIILALLWEYLEPSILLLAGSLFFYPGDTSTEPDSSISDITMGILGVVTLGSYYLALDVPRRTKALDWEDVRPEFYKYFFQFLVIAGLTFGLEWADDAEKYRVPYGYLVFWFGTDFLLVAWAVWNWEDVFWRKKTLVAADGSTVVRWTPVRLTPQSRWILEAGFLVLVNLVFGSAYYRFVGPFQIMAMDAVILVLVAAGVVLPLSRMYLRDFPCVECVGKEALSRTRRGF